MVDLSICDMAINLQIKQAAIRKILIESVELFHLNAMRQIFVLC